MGRKSKNPIVLSDKEREGMTVEEQAQTASYEARSAENVRKEEKERKKKSLSREILRFVIVGVICTIIDFLVQMLFFWIFENNLSTYEGWGSYVAFAIAVTVAFLVANAVNFLFSRFFVFQNVDEKADTKSGKAFLIYLALGAGGWLIGVGLQELGVWICQSYLGIENLSLNIVNAFDGVLAGGVIGEAFWAFVVIFCVKTVVTMVYNYVTRKLVIFRAPKNEEETFHPVELDIPAEESSQPASQKEEPASPKDGDATSAPAPVKEPLVTVGNFRTIFREELERLFGPGKKKADVGTGWRIVYEELEAFDKEHPELVKKGKEGN